MTLRPRHRVPDLRVKLAGGGDWALSERRPANFTMLVFYRGLHCPICSRQLAELEATLDDFAARGVDPVAISTDTRERAEAAKAAWKLPRLALGHDLDLGDARGWGLSISAGRGANSTGIEEPALFSEPGLFLVRPDRTLYFASIQTMPFTRPRFTELLTAIDFVVARGYPARGEA